MSDLGRFVHHNSSQFPLLLKILANWLVCCRKSMTDKAADTIKPDSQKSTTEQMSDKASGVYDRAAGAVQPE
jgi:hypothetical protein